MSGRHGLIAGVVGIVLAGSGCVSCTPNSYGLAREAGPECEALTCQRNQVYVFAVSGLNPVEILALDGFREQLNRAGYVKVATGQSVHAVWMAREVKRIRTEEPTAVVVVVGSGGGASTASWLAERATSQGSPVAGVVLFEPNGGAHATLDGMRVLSVPAASSSSAESVAVVTQFLNEVALATHQPVAVEVTSWEYEHAPEPRPMVNPGHAPEWAFLFDEGIPAKLGTEAFPVVAATTAPQPTATAARR